MGKIFVTKATLPPLNEYMDEISDIWETHWLTNMGSKYKKLQEELKLYLDTDNIELFTNGHMSLELSLQALGLKGEVITTPFTFASTTHAIVRNGLTPVFCDINPDDYTIDAAKIEALITEKTSAILPVHVYGNVCNVEEIERIADKYNLKVIYDACHSFGVKYKGVSTANFGDVSCFSFHATKVFNTIEGGAACFRNKEIGQKLADLKNFGIHGPESVEAVGANAKMNEFCAAMGLCNLRHVYDNIILRKEVSEYYRELLKNIPGIKLNIIQNDVVPNYSYFPIFICPDKYGKHRDTVCEILSTYGINVRKYFYPITSDFDCYKDWLQADGLDVSRDASNNVIALPLYPTLAKEDVKRICEIIRKNCQF